MNGSILKKWGQENKFYFWSLLAFLIASFFSEGYHHFDEHFQILEFAGSKLGLTTPEHLPWEYRYQMRPALQPTLVILLYNVLNVFGIQNPFHISFVLRAISGLITFLSLNALFQVYKSKIDQPTLIKWLFILSFSLWYVVYIGVRFSSESWSGLFFVLGFTLYFKNQDKSILTFFKIGILFGLSFLFRYQSAFMILGFTMWLCIIKREHLRHLLFLFLGGMIMFLLGIIIDSWFYGEWTFTTWNYFAQNILENKVSSFGTEPWWWYITKTIEVGVPPVSLMIVTSFFTVSILNPKSPIVWSIVPFIAIHSLIGHKELRFLFPISFFTPLLIVESITLIRKKYVTNLLDSKIFKGFIRVVFVVNFLLLLLVMFKPADNQIALYKRIYNHYPEGITLYFIENNPFHRVLDIHFYKRKNLSIKPINSIQDIPLEKHALVVFQDRPRKQKDSRLGELIYKTYPDWILRFNINDWQARAKIWYVYEVN